MEQRQRQLARFATDCIVVVLKDHVVVARLVVDRTRTPEGHRGTGNILQLDRDVLHNMPEPRALVLLQSAHEPAGFLVGAAVFLQPR